MDLAEALRTTMDARAMREEHVAVLANVTADAVRKWLNGKTKPSFAAYQALRANLDGFADLLDGKAVA